MGRGQAGLTTTPNAAIERLTASDGVVAKARRTRLYAAVLIAAAFTGVMILPIGGRTPDPVLTAVSGAVLGAVVALMASRVRGTALRAFEVWFFLLFLNFASVAVEGSLFAPGAAPPALLGPNLIRLGVVAAVIAAIAAFGRGRPAAVALPRRAQRPWYRWSWRVVAAALIYLAVYFVIGGLNYTFVTRPYYEAHAGSLVVPPLQVVLTYEPIRALLIAVSVAPVVVSLNMRLFHTALAAGVLLFVVGGLVVLLPQSSLPLYLRVASLWEVFAQNMITGAACAYLFGIAVGTGNADRQTGRAAIRGHLRRPADCDSQG